MIAGFKNSVPLKFFNRIFKIIFLSAVRKAARQRSGQRERMMSPEAMPLARGLGTAQVPKTIKAVESWGFNRFVYFGGFKPQPPFAAWPLPPSFRNLQGM